MLSDYLSQIRFIITKENRLDRLDQLVIKTLRTNPETLDERYELYFYSSDIIFTSMESQYYDKIFKQLYDDMKNSVCGLVLYNKLTKEPLVNKESLMKLYKSCNTFQSFMNGLDRDTTLSNYVFNPIDMRSVIESSYQMDKEYKDTILNEATKMIHSILG